MVLDPFMGSGTTAISCVDNDRQYLGVELHQEYVDMAKNRIAKFSPLNKFLIDTGKVRTYPAEDVLKRLKELVEEDNNEQL